MQLTIPITGIIFMISGKMMRSFFLVSLFLLNTAFASSSPVQDDIKLQKLLVPFTNMKHVKMAYHEKRFSMFLKQPREYQGTIEYIYPDLFIKQVLTPVRKKFVINQDQLTIHSYNSGDNNKQEQEHSVSLNDYPQFKQFQTLLSALLQGDASKLTQYYRYNIYSLSDNQVRLKLKSHLADTFTQEQQTSSEHIEIILQNNLIKKITLFGFGGEKSELIFYDPEINKE